MYQYSWWFLLLRITYSLVFKATTVIVPVSNYPHSARRLIQYVYDRTFTASVKQMEFCQDTALLYAMATSTYTNPSIPAAVTINAQTAPLCQDPAHC